MPGKRISTDFKDLVLKLLTYFNQEKENKGPLLPLTAVHERVSDDLGISLRTVTRICNERQKSEPQTGTTSTATYGPRKKNKTKDLAETQKMDVRNVIYNIYAEKKYVTLKTLKEQLALKQIMDTSVMSLSCLLPHIEFRYKKEDNRRALMEKSDIAFRRAEFLRKYKANQTSSFKRQVVFLDETWIFAKGSKRRSWQDESIKSVRKPEGFEGKRFIVSHAGHRGGFVENTSLIYSTRSKLADYHGDMNGDIFMRWIKESLVPNLKEPSLIIMDNASYHSVLLEKQPKSSWTKAQIIQWLVDNNIPVENNLIKSELLELTKKHARKNTCIVDEYLREHGHEVLRLIIEVGNNGTEDSDFDFTDTGSE